LKKKNNNKKIKSKFVNCKKFFKSKKLEILRYLKDIYFKKRVNKRYVSIFIKKLKKKKKKKKKTEFFLIFFYPKRF